MPKITLEYLRHIQDEINFLISISKDTNEIDYSQDEVLKRASVRSLEVMGEAVKSLPGEYVKSLQK